MFYWVAKHFLSLHWIFGWIPDSLLYPAIITLGVLFSVLGLSMPVEQIKGSKSWRAALVICGVLMVALSIEQHNRDTYYQGEIQRQSRSDKDAFLSTRKATQDSVNQVLSILQNFSRSSATNPIQQRQLHSSWGSVSGINSKAVQGAVATPSSPSQKQTGRRALNAENVGAVLRQEPPAAATIINDGTVEAGSFAKQLEIGLRMGGWDVGGDNIKIGDPEFFPDSLTIEVSAPPRFT